MTNKNPFKLNLQPELFAMFEQLNNFREIKSIEPFYFRGKPNDLLLLNNNGLILSQFTSIILNTTITGSVEFDTLTDTFIYSHDRLFSTVGGNFKSIENVKYMSCIGISAINISFIIAIGFKTTF